MVDAPAKPSSHPRRRVPKLLPPSFPLKKSAYAGTAYISDDGRLVAQVTARVVVWDVASRAPCSDFKVVRNDSHVAMSPDGSVTAVKNTNGEIAFVETASGKVISATGAFRDRCEGGQPQFTRDGKFLIDGDWAGVLRLYSVDTAKEVERREFGFGYMFGGIAVSRETNRFFALMGAKYKTPGGTRILSIADSGHLRSIAEVPPSNDFQATWPGWREIQQFAVDPQGKRLAVVLHGKNREAPNSLECVDIETGQSQSVLIGSAMHFAQGLAFSREGMIAVSVRHNVYRQGMGSLQYKAAQEGRELSHVHFYDAADLRPVARWQWEDPSTLNFSSKGDALVVSSTTEPSAYIAHLSFNPRSPEALRASPRSRPFEEAVTP